MLVLKGSDNIMKQNSAIETYSYTALGKCTLHGYWWLAKTIDITVTNFGNAILPETGSMITYNI